MNIELKFFASFISHLPEGTKGNIARVEIPDQLTVHEVLDRYRVPRDQAQIVLINGIFVTVPERDSKRFAEGDTLAVWPAVAGG